VKAKERNEVLAEEGERTCLLKLSYMLITNS